jgi:hypothetical protein
MLEKYERLQNYHVVDTLKAQYSPYFANESRHCLKESLRLLVTVKKRYAHSICHLCQPR